jgi:hypothetical protein
MRSARVALVRDAGCTTPLRVPAQPARKRFPGARSRNSNFLPPRRATSDILGLAVVKEITATFLDSPSFPGEAHPGFAP